MLECECNKGFSYIWRSLGLHQRIFLNPYLLTLVLNGLTNCAHDIVLIYKYVIRLNLKVKL